MKNKYHEFVALAKKLGAVDARIVKAQSIITAAWTAFKCAYGCDGYNTSRCCPPRTPSHEATQAVIDCYRTAVLVRCKKGVSPTALIVKLEREIFLAGYYKALGFGAGPCMLCKRCTIEKCRFPYKVRPSMEACGIDVFATVRKNGFPIEVLKDRTCEPNYYGLVLIE